MQEKRGLIEHPQEVPELAQKIVAEFSALPQVIAIALAGSQINELADELSDFDFYVYTTTEIPTNVRADIANKFATRIEINNQFWEPGDEWLDTATGCGVDVMYRTPNWIEKQLESILVNHQASVGYSTCLWWNILKSHPVYDRDGWFKHLQHQALQPYPEELRRAIVAKNYPILRQHISAYTHQIKLAISRSDFVSINHRVAALVASYFDIIFAVNYLPHPGEKRLVQFAKSLCKKLPKSFEIDLKNLLGSLSMDSKILYNINCLIDNLDQLLLTERLIPISGLGKYERN